MIEHELTHIIYEIEDCFNRIEKEIYHIKKYRVYSDFSFTLDFLMHYGWLINQLSTYTRALDHKLEESYNTILENRDNGDME